TEKRKEFSAQGGIDQEHLKDDRDFVLAALHYTQEKLELELSNYSQVLISLKEAEKTRERLALENENHKRASDLANANLQECTTQNNFLLDQLNHTQERFEQQQRQLQESQDRVATLENRLSYILETQDVNQEYRTLSAAIDIDNELQQVVAWHLTD